MFDREWAAVAVRYCAALGIDHFFLAPGSRCTPLTLSIAEQPELSITQHFDERGLAFAAVGYARATGKPGVFVCSSGTAVANALPAVIEASMEGLPLILLTADRPDELRGTGANQTIEQREIFGNYVRYFVDMPCPEDSRDISFVERQMEKAVAAVESGPVHLNWKFREPFGLRERAELGSREWVSVTPKTANESTPITLDLEGDTLMVAGSCNIREAAAIRKLAHRIQAPLVADITSNIRAISPDVGAATGLPQPNNVLHVGGRITSKKWLQYTSQIPTCRFIHVTSRDVVVNPNRLTVERHVGALDSLRVNGASSLPFRDAWQQAETHRRQAVSRVVDAQGDALSETSLASLLGGLLKPEQGLFIGNSMPIRDLDQCCFWQETLAVDVAANRGASGIDGLLATATGFANGLGKPTTAILGDLSSLHDLNSLALLANSNAPILLIVINNQAGGIFDMLPVATECVQHFEKYFATPHSFQFEHAAKMFHLGYAHVQSNSALLQKYSEASTSGRSWVIEVATEREYNQEVRRQLREAIES